MTTYTFTIETDQPDENGDVVLLDGVQILGNVKVLRNFKPDHIIPAIPDVYREGNELKCRCELPDDCLDLYPAIGFHVNWYSTTEVGKTYESIKLYAVGLCDNPNLNPSIKTIREQCLKS